MLLMPQRRAIVKLIVEGLGGRDGPRAPYVQKMGEDSGTGEYEIPDSEFALTQCMQKMKSCMDRGDFSGMAKAFKEAMECCSEPYED